MKAIMMSIRPEWCVEILNGKKTIEIRKKFPSDYVGWVYIYCTKDKKNGLYWVKDWVCVNQKNCVPSIRNGKVVAKFRCDKVEYIEATYDEYNYGEDDYATETLRPETLYDKTCVSREQMFNYLGLKGGYAIPISDLEIFDTPKELNEFWTENKAKSCSKSGCPYYATNKCLNASECHIRFRLTRAPQNRQYIEVEE